MRKEFICREASLLKINYVLTVVVPYLQFLFLFIERNPQTLTYFCLIFRLNGLLIADQIRHKVSLEMRMGSAHIADRAFKWPALNFGWTLADVVKNSRASAAPQSGGGDGKKNGDGENGGKTAANGGRKARLGKVCLILVSSYE